MNLLSGTAALWSLDAYPEFAQRARQLLRGYGNWRTATAYDVTHTRDCEAGTEQYSQWTATGVAET
ncbi:hypothetical protein HC928_15545 [bacterium]|nr:hypothetical protein [bacterium]